MTVAIILRQYGGSENKVAGRFASWWDTVTLSVNSALKVRLSLLSLRSINYLPK